MSLNLGGSEIISVTQRGEKIEILAEGEKKLFDLSVSGKSKEDVMQIMDINSINYSSIKTRLIKRLKIVFGFNEEKFKQ